MGDTEYYFIAVRNLRFLRKYTFIIFEYLVLQLEDEREGEQSSPCARNL